MCACCVVTYMYRYMCVHVLRSVDDLMRGITLDWSYHYLVSLLSSCKLICIFHSYLSN